MISHRHKLIFIHIPKCAGRSISQALEQDFGHHTASYYHTNYSDCWHQYTVFTTVRNPYQRLVSMYHYIKNEPFHAGHPITSRGNMLPFKDWVLENVAAFRTEFDHASAEGNREQDGEWGSSFWFSSQMRRLSSADGVLHENIHIFRYEDGMQAVERFLHQQAGIALQIPHVNKSHPGSRNHFLPYYDNNLLAVVNTFPPFVKDCTSLGYSLISSVDEPVIK